MKQKNPTNTTAVRLIISKGASSLVEFKDGELLKRVFVPSDTVKDGQCSEVILNRGIPYGHPWEDLEFTIGGPALAEALHKADLWTIEDVLKNPKKLRSALQATITSQLSEILTIAYGEKKGVNEHER